MVDIRPAESCHYYDRQGNPVYEVPRSDGKGMRETTLRDARKMGLFPSVSTILQAAARPGLEAWKQKQIVLAALTLPRYDNENLDDFAERVVLDAAEHGKNAATLGTAIHAAIQAHFEGRQIEDQYSLYVEGAVRAMSSKWPGASWRCEKSFSHPIGYGGKVDAYSGSVVIDWKTAAFGSGDVKHLGYDEHLIQLSAYAFGLQIVQAEIFNVYVSTTTPGLIHIREWTKDDVARGLRMFISLFDYWKNLTGYNPATWRAA